MCGAARLLLQQGHRISGSDRGEVGHMDALIQSGVTLFREHDAGNMAEDVDEVVYTVAVPEDNPEMVEARGPATLTSIAEGMNVGMVFAAPVLEGDTQLECALNFTEKLGLGYLK